MDNKGTPSVGVKINRRQFFRISAAGVGASSAALVGVMPATAQAEVRQYKLTRAREVRNTCTYCSVACGIIIYSKGSLAKGEKADITHIEGDTDHPTNRGTLCPKGAALKDIVHSESRLTQPRIRRPGSDGFEDASWDEALDKIARALKDDRDANMVLTNDAGLTVNRWISTGFLAASATTNETAWLTYKAVRAMGIVGFDNQARV